MAQNLQSNTSGLIVKAEFPPPQSQSVVVELLQASHRERATLHNKLLALEANHSAALAKVVEQCERALRSSHSEREELSQKLLTAEMKLLDVFAVQARALPSDVHSQGQLQRALTTVQELEGRNGQFESQMAATQDELHQLQGRNGQLAAQLAATQEELRQTQLKVQIGDAKCLGFMQTIANKEQVLKEANNKIEGLEALQRTLRSEEPHTHVVQEREQTIAQLERRIQLNDAKCNGLLSNLTSKETALKQTTQKLDAMTLSWQETTAKLATQEQDHVKLSKSLETSEIQRGELAEKLANAEAALKTAQEKFEVEAQKLKAETAQEWVLIAERVTLLNTEMSRVEASIASERAKQRDEAAKNEQNMHLMAKRRDAERSASARETRHLTEKVAELEAELQKRKDAESEKSALQQQLRTLTEQSSKQEALQAKRLADAEREKRELEEDLEGFREFNSKLQNALRESSLRYAAALKTKIKVLTDSETQLQERLDGMMTNQMASTKS